MADPSTEILELILPSRAEVSETAPVLGSAYAILFTGEDTLAVTSSNSSVGVIVSIHGRLYDRKRGIIPFAFDHVPFADRSIKTDAFPLGPCYLMNVTISAKSGSPRIGQTFVQVQVRRGAGAAAYRLGTLLQGYVTRYQDLAYPGSPIASSIEGGGVIRTFTGTQPAIGTDFMETVPPGARWQVLTAWSNLTCSAAVANRRAILGFYASGQRIVASPHVLTATAGQLRYYHWTIGMMLETTFGTYVQSAGLPMAPLLLAGHLVGTNTELLQPDDQWAAPIFTIQEWLEVS